MDKKRSKGVTVLAVLYLTVALVSLLESVAILILTTIESSVLFKYMGAANASPAPLVYGSIAATLILGALIGIAAAIFMIIISIGLFKLSNKIRKFAIVINLLLILSALSNIFNWTLVYDVVYASIFQKILVVAQLIVCVSATYFLTRSTVRERFNSARALGG